MWDKALGELPETLFDSPEMIACVGRTADGNGHEFARRVAERLRELEWETERQLSLTRLGGDDSLGDVDVLDWQQTTGLFSAIECKSLRFDRTLGEVGERFAEYSAATVVAKRTPLQKHLARMSFLETNRERLADFTGIAMDRLQLRSGLVMETLFQCSSEESRGTLWISLRITNYSKKRFRIDDDLHLRQRAVVTQCVNHPPAMRIWRTIL